LVSGLLPLSETWDYYSIWQDTYLYARDILHKHIWITPKEWYVLKKGAVPVGQKRQLTSNLIDHPKQWQFRFERIKESDYDMCFHTCFQTYNALRQCYKRLRDPRLLYTNTFFLTPTRLRLGLLEQDLAYRFKIHRSS